MDEAVKIKKRSKAARKERREKRPAVRKYLYLPEMQRTRPGAAVFGFACRLTSAWIAVWGLLLFLNEAFLFGADAGYLALASFIPTALLGIALYNRIGTLIALGGTTLSAALFVILTGRPLEYAYASILTLYNSIGIRLSSLGYRSPIQVEINTATLPVTTTNTDLNNTGLAFIGILLALIFTLSAAKRVHMLPVTVTGGAICVVVFTYNLVGRSWGLTLMLTAFCGLIVMSAYESFLREAPEKTGKKAKKARGGAPMPAPSESETHDDAAPAVAAAVRPRGLSGRAKGSALGGFAGLAAMALAFLVLLLPTLSIRKKWEEIESINSKMEIARQILSSVIIGDAPDFSDLGYLGKMDLLTSRSTTASDRVFTGAKVMEVRTNFNLPLYVRSFVSNRFEKDKWHVPQKHDISYFYKTFGDNFTGEQIAKNFYDTVSRKLTGLNNYANYVSRFEFGYVTTPVDIKLLSSSGNLLFIPSRYDPNVGLLSFGGTQESSYDEEYAGYSDGIVTTSWFNFNKSYRALTYVQTYRHEDAFANLETLRHYYNICRRYIEMSMEQPGAYFGEQVKSEIASLGLNDYVADNAYERWYALDEDGRAEFYSRFVTSDNYGRYVYDNYATVPESDGSKIFELALTALSATHPVIEHGFETLTGSYTNIDGRPYIDANGQFISVNSIGVLSSIPVYDKVMAVIDYLKDNYTYTLNPREPANKKLNSVDAFLLDTKEGYCVQFATAAALMLRTLGVPTRYCEGYIASEFKLDKSTAGEGRYLCTVRDFNAHAWIEVYVDDIGWLTFETTPEYYSGMYEHYSLSGSYTPDSYETPEYTPPEEPELDEEDETGAFNIAELIAVIVIGLAAVVTLGAVAYFVYRFVVASRNARYRREQTISNALRSRQEGAERRATAVAVIDYITSALAAAGLRPRTGELPSEYRDRCGRVLRGEEPAEPDKKSKLRLSAPLNELVSIFSKKRSKTGAKERKKRRGGSLGIADEFTGAKGSAAAPAYADFAAYDYAQVFDSIQREEFGPGMTEEELRNCAEFLVALSRKVSGELNPLKRFWLRHIRHTI